MSKIVKNIKIKMISILIIFIIMTGSLFLFNHQKDLLLVFRGLYGGISLNSILEKMGFLLFTVLLQFTNADTILYCLENTDYLSVRFNSKAKVVQFLYKKILVLNFLFICLSGISILFVAYLCRLNLNEIDFGVFSDILLRGFLTCLIISILQVYFLIMTKEANTFFILMIITIGLTFISNYNLSFFTILPKALSGTDLLINILICITIIIVFSAFTKKALMKKEL